MRLLYSILSFFLLIIGILAGISVLLSILIALANPELLIETFILLTVVLYTFASFLFLQKGIKANQTFRASFRDFIKVNAFGSIIYVGYNLWKMYQIWFDQTGIKKIAKEIAGLQPSGSMLSETYILTLLKAGFLFSLFYMLVLVVHIVITLILVKKHSDLFVKNIEK